MVPPVRSVTIERAVYPIPFQVKIGQWFAPMLLIAVDYLMVVSAFVVALVIRTVFLPKYLPALQTFVMPDGQLYFVIPFIYICFLAYERLYTKRLPFWQGAELLFRVTVFAAVSVIGLLYLTGQITHISRIFMLMGWGLSFIYLVYGRFLAKRLMVGLNIWQKPVIVVGSGKAVEVLAKVFEEEKNMGYKIAGVIDDLSEKRTNFPQYPLLGDIRRAEEAVMRSGIRDVVIAAPDISRDQLREVMYRIQPLVSNLSIVSNLSGVLLGNVETDSFFNQKTLLFRMKNNLAYWHNRFVKRIFDITVSLAGVMLISPILLVIGILIYIDSPGPIVFAHTRIGEKGRRFPCFKFRSMVPNAQAILEEYLAHNPAARAEWDKDFKLRDDPRITRIGKILRKTSLDELPQLINVIRGEMSLVGPRPIVDKEIEKYGQFIDDYYLVRPGITGYWQVSGRNDIDYDSRVQMDSWYVRHWSVWMDIILLVKTVKVVLDKRGAY